MEQRIWIRLGAEVQVNEKDILELQTNTRDTLVRLLEEGKVTICGDSYFPEVDANQKLYQNETGGGAICADLPTFKIGLSPPPLM